MTISLPTIGHYRIEHKHSSFLIYCGGMRCSRSAAMAFEALGLPDATPFLDIPRYRRFVCLTCASRDVHVRPNWPDPLQRPR